MKTISLIVGILLMFLAVLTIIVCLMLPSMTNNHVSSNEAMMGIIPAAVVLFLAFLLTIGSAIFVLAAKKTVVTDNNS